MCDICKDVIDEDVWLDIEAMLDDMEPDVKNYFDSKTGEWKATIKLKKKDLFRLRFYIFRKLIKYWFLEKFLLIKMKRRLNKYGQTNI